MDTQSASPDSPLVGRRLSHYLIHEMVGRGGMGEIYRAHDERLNRTVAVKALRERLSDDITSRKRFLRETRLASQVVHPYVATVFDVIDSEEDVFLVMEYVEGRHLGHVLEEDRPSPREVAGFAAEIAEALSAIHRVGLVHRDLKPANVMVTPEGHVKVMDFGVAREVAPDGLSDSTTQGTEAEPLTAEGAGVGTVLYMSPEQIRGELVDHRSDQFALGVVLYEALAGSHPFAKASVLESASAILNEPPGGEEQLDTLSKTGPMRDVVMRLLQKDAENRYPDTGAVVTDLRAVARGARPRRRHLAKASRHASQIALTVMVVAVVVLAAVVGFRPRPVPVPEVRPAIAVLPFEDGVGDAQGETRARMFADLLAAHLGESALVRPLSSVRTQDLIAGLGVAAAPDRAARAMTESPARWVVGGHIYGEGDSYQARVDIYGEDRSDGPVETFRVEAAGTGALVDRTAVKLLAALFPAVGQEERDTPGVFTSSSEEAQLLEFSARQAVREHRYSEAIAILERALAIDPSFVAAQALLADTLHEAGYGRRAREERDRALRLIEPPHPEPPQRWVQRVRALDAKVRRDRDGEIAILETLVDGKPDESDLRLSLAGALRGGGRPADALFHVERARDLDPDDGQIRIELGRCHIDVRDWESADTVLRDAAGVFEKLGSVGGVAQATYTLGIKDYRRGDCASAEKEFAEAARLYETARLGLLAAEASNALVDCRILRGDLESARGALETLTGVFRAAGAHRMVIRTLTSLGAQYYIGGHLDEGARYLEQALAEARPLDNPGISLYAQLNLAHLRSYTGDLGRAHGLAAGALDVAREKGDSTAEVMALQILADIDYQWGRLGPAIDRYDDLARLQDSPSGSRVLLNVTMGLLAEVLSAAGRVDESLQAIDRGIAIAEELDQREHLAYRLLLRGLIRAEAAMWEESEQDLRRCDEIASADGLSDLLPRISLARGTAALLRGRWNEARDPIAEAVTAGGQSEAVGLEVPALVASCSLRQAQGHAGRAVEACRAAVDHPRAMAIERTRARAALATALVRAERFAEAEEEARRALEESDDLGSPLPGARSAWVLLQLPGARPDDDRIRETGVTLLAKYLSAIPDRQRDAVRERADLVELISLLADNPEAKRTGG